MHGKFYEARKKNGRQEREVELDGKKGGIRLKKRWNETKRREKKGRGRK